MDKHTKHNIVRKNSLGIPHGTAANRLRKAILFDLLKQLKQNFCFQCGKEISQIDELSIEHKIPWLYSENPTELYFSLDNIAYSHLSCNVKCARRFTKKEVKEIKLEHRKTSVIDDISGIIYATIKEAAAALNLKYDTLAHKLTGRDKNDTTLRYLYKNYEYKGRNRKSRAKS